MTAFVVLAAGLGTRVGRVGESLHKSLLPLDDRAMLSHLFDLAPPNARLIVCVGHFADQVREYVRLAHPSRHVSFVEVPNYAGIGSGPGTSLLAAQHAVGDDDLVFTSCDTLWQRDMSLWTDSVRSWVGVAPVPAGTSPERWCRVRVDGSQVTQVVDKSPAYDDDELYAWVGLGFIQRNDLDTFWDGLRHTNTHTGERQISGGFDALLENDVELRAHRIHWTDVGDEMAYRRAIARSTGYDWTKIGQATYVLPSEGRVVKFHSDREVTKQRVTRADVAPANLLPHPVSQGETMIAYPYTPGLTAYEAIEREGLNLAMELLDWIEEWSVGSFHSNDHVREAALKFYRDKTYSRVGMLPDDLRATALDAVSRVNWAWLTDHTMPGVWHGDLNLGNIIVPTNGKRFVGIDWREDFAGVVSWGDRRYDYAKLIASAKIHWGRARHGDFSTWDDGIGVSYLAEVRERFGSDDVEVIGALSLLNSAPLHASPLDEVLVSRGVAWLEEVL